MEDLFDLDGVLNSCKSMPPVSMVVVNPYDRGTLESIVKANKENVIIPILVGEKNRILKSSEEYGVYVQESWIVDAGTDKSAELAASIICDKGASFIMKGMISTGEFIHVLLDPRWKIRTERILSHVGMFEIPESKRIFLMSDAAINILPNFTRKMHIVANAIDVARRIGITEVKVAMLAAVEKVKLPAMPATLDAFLMKKYSETGYFGSCYIDGPFAFDNAIDIDKARTKGIKGYVAGRANVLITPNIETGNVIWKTFTCVLHDHPAGVVMGGSCPIVVPSRADDFITKLRSIKFARLLVG